MAVSTKLLMIGLNAGSAFLNFAMYTQSENPMNLFVSGLSTGITAIFIFFPTRR